MKLFMFTITAIAFAWLSIIWIRVNTFLESVDNLLEAHKLMQIHIDGLKKNQYDLLRSQELLQNKKKTRTKNEL